MFRQSFAAAAALDQCGQGLRLSCNLILTAARMPNTVAASLGTLLDRKTLAWQNLAHLCRRSARRIREVSADVARTGDKAPHNLRRLLIVCRSIQDQIIAEQRDAKHLLNCIRQHRRTQPIGGGPRNP